MPRHVVSVLEGIAERRTRQVPGRLCRSRAAHSTAASWSADPVDLVARGGKTRALIAEAVETARNADVVVMVLGDNEQTEPRGLGRQPPRRPRVARPGRPAGRTGARRSSRWASRRWSCCSTAGRWRSTIWRRTRRRIIEGWYLGQETGNAVADVLFGKVNPGGKLPVSIARDVGQLPIFYNHKPTARRGYLFDTTKPLYPFGYGLSYTTFEISAPRLERPTHRQRAAGAGAGRRVATPARGRATRWSSSTSATTKRRSPGRCWS